jgi:tetratricopeptide (TPR) repeat protein
MPVRTAPPAREAAATPHEPWPDALVAGLIALSREELDVAREHLARAISEAPDLGDAHAYLGCALLASGEMRHGMDEIAVALRLSPDGFAANVKAGELALRVGDPCAAESHFLKALRASPPGTRDAEAARALLSEARRRSRASITHQAFLPSPRLPRWIGRKRKETAEVRMPGEAGGTIA